MPKMKAPRADTERMAQRRCLGYYKGMGGTPSESKSSGDDEEDEDEDEEEGEKIYPRSPLLENLPSPGDLFLSADGDPASAHQAKCPRWMLVRCPACHLSLASCWYVLFVLLGTCTSVAGVWMTYLIGAL
jgi:hypothetical protein